VSAAEDQAFHKAVGSFLLAFFAQNLFHVCSSALNVSTEAVEKSSGYLFRSVLQIDPASVLSSEMRCRKQGAEAAQYSTMFEKSILKLVCKKIKEGYIYADSRRIVL
jgi:hypothetical protein